MFRLPLLIALARFRPLATSPPPAVPARVATQQAPMRSRTVSADSVSFLDHTKQPAELELAGQCRSALARRLERQPYNALPELILSLIHI